MPNGGGGSFEHYGTMRTIWHQLATPYFPDEVQEELAAKRREAKKEVAKKGVGDVNEGADGDKDGGVELEDIRRGDEENDEENDMGRHEQAGDDNEGIGKTQGKGKGKRTHDNRLQDGDDYEGEKSTGRQAKRPRLLDPAGQARKEEAARLKDQKRWEAARQLWKEMGL